MTDLQALSCDGCATNTGIHKGVNRCIEELVGRPLLTKSCLLHAIELPLKNMIYKLDGNSTSEYGFDGEIGRIFSDTVTPTWKRKVLTFETIPLIDLPDYVSKRQSADAKGGEEEEDYSITNDQELLFKLILATSTGNVSQRLAERRIGRPSKCRWFVAASNLLRLYWSWHEGLMSEQATQLLRTLVRYIVQVYGPMVFYVKKKWSFTDSARHFHQFCTRSQFLLEPQYNRKYLPLKMRKGSKG